MVTTDDESCGDSRRRENLNARLYTFATINPVRQYCRVIPFIIFGFARLMDLPRNRIMTTEQDLKN